MGTEDRLLCEEAKTFQDLKTFIQDRSCFNFDFFISSVCTGTCCPLHMTAPGAMDFSGYTQDLHRLRR